MASSFTSNLEPAGPDTSSPEFNRKRRRKPDETPSSLDTNQTNQRVKRWRTQREHQIYSTKLIEALRRSRRTSSSSSSAAVAAKEVRETADRIMAVSAKGTTRWSRAILTSASLSITRKHKKARVIANTTSLRKRKLGINREKKRKLPVVERKLKVLGRLVPGCWKLSIPNLLGETSDYIAALEMQVRAMTAITEFLAGAGGDQPSAGGLGSNVNS